MLTPENNLDYKTASTDRFIKKFMYHYKGGSEIKFYFFSDTDPSAYVNEEISIEFIQDKHNNWVEGTNSKFKNIISLENCDSDYLYYFDADTNVNNDFSDNELRLLSEYAYKRLFHPNGERRKKIKSTVMSHKIQYTKAKKLKAKLGNSFYLVFAKELCGSESIYTFLTRSQDGGVIESLNLWIADQVIKQTKTPITFSSYGTTTRSETRYRDLQSDDIL
jgi:hypothetical protein